MGFTLQPTVRRDLVDVAVNVDLQQRARMIGWTSGRFWNHTVKAHRPEIQLIDKQRRSPAPGCPQQRSHPDTREAERPVYGLHSERSASSHPPARIIQNYNPTGVFTQPRWEAGIRSRLHDASAPIPTIT